MKRESHHGEILRLNPSRDTTYDMESERDQNIIGKRISDYRRRCGMNLDAFSQHLKEYGIIVGRGGVSKWERGTTIPNAYQLVALGRAFGVEDGLAYFSSDFHSLLNEDGMKKVAAYKADLIASGRYRPEPPVASVRDNIKYINMPISNLSVSAGTGNFLDEGNFELVSFPMGSVPARADFGVRVSGDSMEPVYHDGQIAWVEQCDQLRVGEVGVFVYDNSSYLKVYGEQMPDADVADSFTGSDGTVRPQPVLISYNEAYAPRVISPSFPFQMIGKVL